MFTLLLKTEHPGRTHLHFVGVYASKEVAERHVDKRYGALEKRGHGNARMLEACGAMPPIEVWSTETGGPQSYVLAQYA